jgi:hypothetical protein
MMQSRKFLVASALLAAFLAVAPHAADSGKTAKKADKYPLDTCIVSGEKLDSMGEPYVFKHDGKEVKLCCKSCLKDFNKEPDKYMKKLEEAGKKEKKAKKAKKEKSDSKSK